MPRAEPQETRETHQRRPVKHKNPRNRGFSGAQRQNRTADTRIFNPATSVANAAERRRKGRVAQGGSVSSLPQGRAALLSSS